MKPDQQEEAKNLYFQTGMSKSEIAETVGVNRRTVLLWCKQGNWDKLRESARHLPSLVAEKCYYLINSFASRKLQDVGYCNLDVKDAQTIHLLASSIKKIKNRSTVNETMELFNFFAQGLKRRNPTLAAQVMPELEQYIAVRENQELCDFLQEDFNEDGTMKYHHQAIQEQHADTRDLAALDKEVALADNYDRGLANWQKKTTPDPLAA